MLRGTPKRELYKLAKQLDVLEQKLNLAGPQTDDELHQWIMDAFGINIPRVAVCEGHIAPFQFLADLYFGRSTSALAMACRGGAKTFMVALLHRINAEFKLKVESLTAGATEAQSKRCFYHLEKLVKTRGENNLRSKKVTEIIWNNGCKTEIVAGTMAAVNGPHPHIVHLDEVELMEPDVLSEAKNMAQSSMVNGKLIPAQEILTSTRKRAVGPMQMMLDEIHEARVQGNKPMYDLYTWCLTADTPVDCPRDYERFPEGIAISQMKPGQLVWSFNEDKFEFELKRIKQVKMTKKDASLVKVSLDHGKEIRCTPDHPFLKRDGTWCNAGDLQPGDSLMPLYRDFEPMVRTRPNRKGWAKEYVEVARAVGHEKGHTHHVDERHQNSAEDNLQDMTPKDHYKHHNPERVANSNASNDRRAQTVKEVWANRTDEEKKIIAEKVKRSNTKRSEAGDKAWETRRKNGTDTYEVIDGKRFYNHKVVSVLPAGSEDVWDMEVEDNHNFVIHGVVVHNCIFEIAQPQPGCMIANPNGDGGVTPCGCDQVSKGEWDDGTTRYLSDICQGRFARSDGWVTWDDVVRLFTANLRSTWEAQQQCTKPSTDDIVLPQFSIERNGLINYQPDPANGPIYQGIDFGSTNPNAVLWWQVLKFDVEATGASGQKMVLKEGSRVCFDEFYKAEIPNYVLANEILRRERTWRERYQDFRIKGRFADPQGAQARRDLANHSPTKILTQWHTTRDVVDQIKIVKELIENKKFYVDIQRCERMVDEIQVWHYRKQRVGMIDPHPEIPVDDFDHAMSAMRYCLCNVKVLEDGKHHVGMPSAITKTRDTNDNQTRESLPSFTGSNVTPETERWRLGLGGPLNNGF